MHWLLAFGIRLVQALVHGPHASDVVSAIALHAQVVVLARQEAPVAPSVFARGHEAARVLRTLPVSSGRRALLLSIGFHESRWRTDAVDAGERAYGPTQVENALMWGSSPYKLITDPVEGYVVANDILDAAVASCPGTWANALTVYASGRCGVGEAVARELCEPVGLCEELAR